MRGTGPVVAVKALALEPVHAGNPLVKDEDYSQRPRRLRLDAVREIECLQAACHENVVSVIALAQDEEGCMSLVLEYCEQDLERIIDRPGFCFSKSESKSPIYRARSSGAGRKVS